jgi:AcrR family transcriptional regulator
VLAACRELAGQVGVDGVTFRLLTERSGVSKATIRLRWSSPREVVEAALREIEVLTFEARAARNANHYLQGLRSLPDFGPFLAACVVASDGADGLAFWEGR